MAKQVIADAGWFAWAWPIFGAAATISTVLAAPLARRFSDRNVWITSNVAMAIGILVPIALPNLAGIAIAALCVGGTFMVNTMAGIQEARRVAGVHARALIGAMTSAFAVGQIIGPLLVAGLVHVPGGFSWALSVSALPLLVAAYVLSCKTREPRKTDATGGPSETPWMVRQLTHAEWLPLIVVYALNERHRASRWTASAPSSD